jgi:catechol 2,3-dioxygenase-like lactoylglutathione lyase family enzyme
VFDHVGIRASDRPESEAFYSTVLAELGLAPTSSEDWLTEWDDFALSPADDEHPPTRGLHVGFSASSRDEVDAFWQAGIDAGYRDDGEPGERQYSEDYYGAFLLDPDGNSAEAVHYGGVDASGVIDHLWIRVADLAAARRFYGTVAPHAGFALGTDTPKRVSFRDGEGSFSLVPDARRRTEHVHIAFGAADNATVDAFHRELVTAGYEDNGAPGERPQYHAGYYGAFVLDPDGHNVEVVCHNRG